MGTNLTRIYFRHTFGVDYLNSFHAGAYGCK